MLLTRDGFPRYIGCISVPPYVGGLFNLKIQDSSLSWKGIKNDVSAGAELKFNLFRGDGDLAAIRAASANLAASRSDMDHLRLQIEEEVREAWQNLITLGETVKLRENQTNIIAAFLKLARQERKIGTRSLLDVLNGEVTYINAVSDAIAAKADERTAAYNLLFTMGELRADLF